MKKFNVTYEIDYVHRVTVGVMAQDEQSALTKAEQVFDQGINDTETMPLLYDDFDEKERGGLIFTVQEVRDFAERDESVKEIQRRQFAFNACRALLAGDFGTAMKIVGQATGQDNSSRDLKIAVVVEGGVVQSIVSDQPSLLPNDVLVIDYGIDGSDEDDRCLVPQDYGYDAHAVVYSHSPELPKIGLDAVFERFQLMRRL